MKLASVLLLTVFQITALQNGCASQSPTFNSQKPQPSSIDQSQDKELLQNVERFAAERDESSSAWQDLMRRDRQKLISDLTRISDALPTDDRNRVLIAFTFCKLRHDYDRNRQIILAALSKRSPYKDLHGDWVVSMIKSLVTDGDTGLFEPLFKASEWSDGAMSTELAAAYSEALLRDPNKFLHLLSLQPRTTQDNVIMLLRDNSLTVEQTQKIKRYLKAVVPPSKLAPLAAQILRALSQ